MEIRRTPEGCAFLNIGCGNVFSPEWTNLDIAPRTGVAYHDARNPLPFPDGVFDAIYSSHVLEHLSPRDGLRMLREIWRALKSGGICRIVVPDLESIATEYLHCLRDAVAEPNAKRLLRYRWMLLELLDQMVREKSGGLMRETLNSGDFDVEFVRSRTGQQFASDCDRAAGKQPAVVKSILPLSSGEPAAGGPSFWKRLFGKAPRPQETGEAHKWMYDRLSLRLSFEEAGFVDYAVLSYDRSLIPHWQEYNLDRAQAADAPRKPDSMFAEGRKPA